MAQIMTPVRNTMPKPRELTGRGVLFWLVGFFAVTIGVNAIMVRYATTTFGGVETASSYKAGLAFKQEIAAAEQQETRHWQVGGVLSRGASGEVELTLTARDSNGQIIPGWAALARLSHPLDARLDRAFEMIRSGPDSAHGTVQADAGQWTIVIELQRSGERVFFSRNRITLR